MQTFLNTTNYFKIRLQQKSAELNNVQVNGLISDMVTYAVALEIKIPPAEDSDERPRPGGNQSPQLETQINELENSISSTLFSLFQAFLTYIKSLEILITTITNQD